MQREDCIVVPFIKLTGSWSQTEAEVLLLGCSMVNALVLFCSEHCAQYPFHISFSSVLFSFTFPILIPFSCSCLSASSSSSALPPRSVPCACLLVINHGFLLTLSLQSKPAAAGMSVTAGCLDWHTHTYQTKTITLQSTITFAPHCDLYLRLSVYAR